MNSSFFSFESSMRTETDIHGLQAAGPAALCRPSDGSWLTAPSTHRRLARASASSTEAYEPQHVRDGRDSYSASLAAGSHVPLALSRALLEEQRCVARCTTSRTIHDWLFKRLCDARHVANAAEHHFLCLLQ